MLRGGRLRQSRIPTIRAWQDIVDEMALREMTSDWAGLASTFASSQPPTPKEKSDHFSP